MKSKVILTLSFILLCSIFAKAQKIEDLGKQKPFDISGSIGGGMNFFSSNEDFASRDPFNWNLHAGLTPSIYGIAIPLSFSMTQFSQSYTTPFSRFGMSPTYKWAKLHLGYRSMSFSPFVFDGQSFLGAGIELNPGKFYFAGFYGRLNRAISEDTTIDRRIQPQYARHGYGLKVGIRDEAKEITLEYLRAFDDIGSIKLYDDSTSSLVPQSNNVIGTSWKLTFFKKVNFSGNFAASLFNRNIHYGVIDSLGDKKIPTFVTEVAPLTYSSVFNWSGQAQLGVSLQHLNASVGYRRVQPDFKSLGVPYMLDDLEMVNANLGTSMFRGKVNLNADFNTQRNNLANMLSSKLVSSTGTFSASAFVSQNLNVNATLTGAEVLQKDGLIKLNDSTRMNQLMLTFMLSPLLNFSGNGLQHSISNNFSYTNLDDRNPLTAEFTNGKNINLSSNYSLFFMQKYFGISGGAQYSAYSQTDNKYESLGINVGANAQLLKSKALSVQGNTGYFINKSSGSVTGNNITFSFNSHFRAGKHHSFGLNVSYMITPPVNLDPLDKARLDRVPYAVNSKIFAGGLNYTYNF